MCGRVAVANVKYYSDLTPEGIAEIRRHYGEPIGGDDAIWESMMDCKSGFPVWLADIRRIKSIRIEKKDMRAWVLLQEGRDFGLRNEI